MNTRRPAPGRRQPRSRTAMQHAAPARRTRTTLLALTAAAAFGGFAATSLNYLLDQPASAEPAPGVATVPATAALPNVVNGTPMPSLAPMLKRVLPAVVSV